MVLNHWGLVDKNEIELAEELNIRHPNNPGEDGFGCSVEAIETALVNRGISILPNQKFETVEEFTQFVKQQLALDCPILVEWSKEGGHWTVIIGLEGENLIMADPYDVHDECRDGLTSIPIEKFFN